MRRKFRIIVLTFGCLVGILLCVVQNNYSEENNVQEIWQKVVNANKAWLEPYEGDVAYEYNHLPALGKPRKIEIWYKGKDYAKIRFTDGHAAPSEHIFANGLMHSGGKQYHFKTPSPLFAKNTGYGSVPLSAQIQSNPLFKLLSAKSIKWKDHEAYCIEAKYTYSVFSNFFSSIFFINWNNSETNHVIVDVHTFEILREESFLFTNLVSARYIGEYPEGFHKTSSGFAPYRYSAYQYGNITTNYNAWYEQCGDKIWYQNKSSLRYGTQETVIANTSVSLAPIDEGIFRLDQDEIDKVDPKSGEHSIEGKVLDSDTRQPISGAEVHILQQLHRTRTPEKGITKTDINGRFAFKNIPLHYDSQYNFTAEKEGYLAFKAGEAVFSDLFFPPFDPVRKSFHYVVFNDDTIQQPLEIFLSKPKSIKGLVVEAGTQKPIKGATVEVLSNTLRLKKTQTEEDGSFSFDSLPACKLMFVAYANGYADKSGLTRLGNDDLLIHPLYLDSTETSPKTIDLSQSQPISIKLQLPKGKTIEGIIADLKGNPVENAIVSTNSYELKPTITDKNGFYQFENLDIHPGQNLILFAVADGFVKSATLLNKFDTEKTIQKIVMYKGGYLYGNISINNNQPLKDAIVSMQRIRDDSIIPEEQLYNTEYPADRTFPDFSNPGVSIPAQTDAQGNFKTKTLLPGTYKLTAIATGKQPVEMSNIRIAEASETIIKVSTQPSKKIAGIILGPTSEPLENVEITIAKYDPTQKIERDADSTPSPNRNFSTRKKSDSEQRFVTLPMYKPADPQITQKDGRFEFDQLEEGTYRITARWGVVGGNQRLYSIESAFAENIHPGKTDIRIQFTKPLQRKAIIKGTIIDTETGKSISSFQINPDTHLKYDGTQILPKPSGEFLLQGISVSDFYFHVKAAGYATKTIRFVGWKPQDIDNFIIRMNKEARISGIIKTLEPFYRNDFKIQIKSLDTPLDINPHTNPADYKDFSPYSVTINRDGTFFITGLSSGEYDLFVYKNAGAAPVKCLRHISLQMGKTIALGDIFISDKFTNVRIISKEINPIPGLNLSFPGIHKSLYSDNAFFKLPASLIEDETGFAVSLSDLPQTYYHLHNVTEEITISFPSRQGNITLTGIISEKDKPISQPSIQLFHQPDHDQLKSFEWEQIVNGRFDIPNLSLGKHWILSRKFIDDSLESNPIRFLKWDLTATHSLMKIEFGNGFNFSGIVKNTKGEPVMGANILIAMDTPFLDSFNSVVKNLTTIYTFSNGDGTFHFEDLQPDKYTAWAFLPGEGISKKQVIHIGENPGKKYEIVLE